MKANGEGFRGLLEITDLCNVDLRAGSARYQPISDMPERVVRFVIEYGVGEYLIDIVRMCRALGMEVKYYSRGELKCSDLDQYNGVSMIMEGTPYILLCRELDAEMKRFVLVHELGHILLGHVGVFPVTIKKPGERKAPSEYWEQEADAFANALMNLLI